MFLRYYSVVKEEGAYRFGPPLLIRIDSILALEKRWNRYSPHRRPQTYTVVTLTSGHQINVFAPLERITDDIDKAARRTDGRELSEMFV